MTRWLIIWCVFVAGLLGSTNVSLAQCGLTTPGTCSDETLCTYAVRWDGSVIGGRATVTKEAKRRSLNCKSGSGKTVYFRSKYDVLKTKFYLLSIQKRKQVQYKLTVHDFYQSSIDGLYGQGTAAALKAYNSEYLNNADLTKSANVTALIDDLLKEIPTDEEAKLKGKIILKLGKSGPKVEVSSVEPKTLSPLKFSQVKASYDAGDFSQAFKDAQTLSLEGNREAQLYLGKMYADGRGTLQVTTAAHMWFNIASMNGSDEAFEERKALQTQMTPELINEAQKMAVACIKSDYKDCGLLVQPSVEKDLIVKKFQPTEFELRSYFVSQSALSRKQMQYALKKLGYYRSSVDGLWGNGTKIGLEEYLKAHSSIGELDRLHGSLTAEVEVPSYFAAPAQKRKAPAQVIETSPKFYPSQGYFSYGNPTISVAQALDICMLRAKRVGRRAGDASIDTPPTYTTRCSGSSYSNNFNGRCRTEQDSEFGNDLGSAVAIGILKGLTHGMASREAGKEELKICMAEYGWKKN